MSISKFKFFAAGVFFCVASNCLADNSPDISARAVLFDNGDMGSKFWRIPALATTNSGVVVAAADKRNDTNWDLPNKIDIVIRRSFDSGLTWSEQQLVLAADSVGGYGDAALGVHRPTGDLVMVVAHGNGIWEATPQERNYVMMTRSTDDGATWSDPVNITDQLFSPYDGAAPVKAFSGFASSGTMLCDENGRLWFVLVVRPHEEKWSALDCHVCYSDDGGYHWSIVAAPIDCNGDEAKIVQLADGSYLVSIRNRDKGPRKFTRSADGVSWSEIELQEALVDPACNGDLIARDGMLLHSLANHPTERENVSIYTSDDNGFSWNKLITITPGISAYSALTVLPDGSIGCLSEEEGLDGGYKLWFSKVHLPKEVNQ